MKKKLLQKISELCYFVLDDRECKKFLLYLIKDDVNSARLYLDKVIENIEFQFAFESEDEELKRQLKHSNTLMDLVIELTIVNDRDNEEGKQVREITSGQ
jgi:hypothetical protein